MVKLIPEPLSHIRSWAHHCLPIASWSREVREVTFSTNNGAALDLAHGMVVEGAPPRQPFGEGIRDLVTKETRNQRRKLVRREFWFD
jgi:hypothetical protein